MARTDNLRNYLTDVAEAIKAKKGDSAPINASTFDSEIINLPGASPTAVDINGTTVNKKVGNEVITRGDFVVDDSLDVQSEKKLDSSTYSHPSTVYLGNNCMLSVSNSNGISAWGGSYSVKGFTPLALVTFQNTFPELEITAVSAQNVGIAYRYISQCFDGAVMGKLWSLTTNEGTRYCILYIYFKLVDNVVTAVSACCETDIYQYSYNAPMTSMAVCQVSPNKAIAMPSNKIYKGWGGTIIGLSENDELFIEVPYRQYSDELYSCCGAVGLWGCKYDQTPVFIYRSSASSSGSSEKQSELVAVTVDENNNVLEKGVWDISQNTASFSASRLYISNLDNDKFVVYWSESTYGHMYLCQFNNSTKEINLYNKNKSADLNNVSGIYLEDNNIYMVRVISTTTRTVNKSLELLMYDMDTGTLLDKIPLGDGLIESAPAKSGSTAYHYSTLMKKGTSLILGIPAASGSPCMAITIDSVFDRTISVAKSKANVGVALETKQPGEKIKIMQVTSQ